MPRDKYYESADMPEKGVGRKPVERVGGRGGAGSTKRVPKGMLGRGMAEGAASAIRRRRRMLDKY